MADLVTLAEVHAALGIDPSDTRKDTLHASAISAASVAVLNYTERDFGQPEVTEARTYQYDGSGYLDIDDASLISSVAFVDRYGVAADIAVPTTDWTAMPYRSPIYSYLSLPEGFGGFNPAMGFERNLDVLAREGRLRQADYLVKVTATFGWPEVPLDVKQAVIWTITDWVERPKGEALTSEAIEGYSRSWGARSTGGASSAQAIPNRARDLLAAYQREQV